MTDQLRAARPPREALEWVASLVGPRGRCTRARPLPGGLTSAVHEVVVEDAAGAVHHLVLRRWVGEFNEGGDRRVTREAGVLEALDATDVPAPKLVGIDPQGASTGGDAALVMTKLSGHASLQPTDMDGWLDEQIAMAMRIHSLDIEARPYKRWLEPAKIDPASWATRPDLWLEAAKILTPESPPFAPVFMHGDYQHFNMLWERDRLTGVLDWTDSRTGPCDVDVGHCRLNLAVMFSAEVAERFRERYESEAGRAIDPWWDLQEVCIYGPDWPNFIPEQVAGRAPLDVAGMTSRVEDLLERVLARF